jgi:hypothetical protein
MARRIANGAARRTTNVTFTPITLKRCNSTIPIYDLSPSRRDDPLCGLLTLPANMDTRDVAPKSKNLEQPDNNGNDNDSVQN